MTSCFLGTWRSTATRTSTPEKHGTDERASIDAWAAPEWIVSQSGDFRGTETQDCAVDLITLIPASDTAKASQAFDAFRRYGYCPQLIGRGEPSWDTSKEGGSQKLRWLKDASKDWPRDAWILICDGYDTLPVAKPPEVVSRLIEMDADVVLGGEVNHWPEDSDLKAKIEKHPKRRRGTHLYPNSGVIGADASVLSALLATADDFGADDQRWWQERYCDPGMASIKVDSESYLSLQAHGSRVNRTQERESI